MIHGKRSIQLIPFAGTFIQGVVDDPVEELELVEEIDKCKRDFYKKFYRSDRTHRIHERLTNKEVFIYRWSDGCSPKAKSLTMPLIESLLTDRSTLFSSEYLDYLFNHDVMEQQNKNISEYGQDEVCINFALPAASASSEEKIDAFRDTLAELLQRSHQKKKQLMIYYKILLNLYYKTMDQKNMVALNSIFKCNRPPDRSGLDPEDMVDYLLHVLDQCCQWEQENGKSFPESGCKEEYEHFISNAMLNRSGQQKYILNDISRQLLKRMQCEKGTAAVCREILQNSYRQAKDETKATVLSQIMEWYPDTKIIEKDSVYFLKEVLEKCARCERDIKLSKKTLGAGNYKPLYTKQQFQEAQEYKTQRDQLGLLREKIKPWLRDHEFPFYEEMFELNLDDFTTIDRLKEILSDFKIVDEVKEILFDIIGNQLEKVLSKIADDLRDYIVNSRSRVQGGSSGQLQTIIAQLLDKSVIEERVLEILKKERQKSKESKPDKRKIESQVRVNFWSYLPFRLIVLCTIGKGRFLAGKGVLAGNTLEKSLEKICSEASSESRYQCLLLLINLCRDIRLSKKATEENLLYFIKYYGILIKSNMEAELWNSAIEENALSNSPVSLVLKYDENLKECFPPRLESLFCYESFSALHLSGFYALVQAFPELIEHYRNKVAVPKHIRQKFIQAWPNEKRSQALKDGKTGRDAIKEVCHQCIEILEWDELDKTKEWIAHWDFESKNGHFRSPTPIDMEELRALLAEIAITGTIARESIKYLSQQIQSYYSSLNIKSKKSKT